ncbi:hypothetical protein EMCG_04002 [[Emmonsia] crescens]|uniref:Uncharacterized protein n=1 Tax=[Emmonsia] crescens TaxID=73230 RepID=A0A0G2J7Z8_9EURO|nr:hypothetical protein EMCG_04002 [Emmonsia crescens UAMH 3008]
MLPIAHVPNPVHGPSPAGEQYTRQYSMDREQERSVSISSRTIVPNANPSRSGDNGDIHGQTAQPARNNHKNMDGPAT